jgi:predicted metal-binding protein
MVKNGVDVIHLATGMLVGYPPCPHLVTLPSRQLGSLVVWGAPSPTITLG